MNRFECQFCGQACRLPVLCSCRALVYCSEQHAVAGRHASDECARMKRQVNDSISIRDDVARALPRELVDCVGRDVDCSPDVASSRCNALARLGLHDKGIYGTCCSCWSKPCADRVEQFMDRGSDPWEAYIAARSISSTLQNKTMTTTTETTPTAGWSSHFATLFNQSPSVPLDPCWSLVSSHVATISAAMDDPFVALDEYIIHCLGPSIPEVDAWECWFDLLLVHTSIRRIHVVLMGPDVPVSLHGTSLSLTSPLYKGRCLSLTYHRGLYHDSIPRRVPNLVVALNAGLAAYSSWKPTLDLLQSSRIRIVVTDYCEEAALRARSVLLTSPSSPSSTPGQVTLNPFRCPMSCRGTDNLLPSYSNGFAFHL